jgi:glycosyltransferase involved in cell wall biosynthesis
MKVLVLINSIDVTLGGTSHSSTSVVSELSRQFPQIEIILITRFSENPILTNYNTKNAQIIFCKSLVFGIYQNIGLLKQIDIIHVQGLWSTFPTMFGIIAKLISGARLIVSPRGMLEPWTLKQGKIKKKLALFTYQGYLFKLTDVFHVTAPSEKKNLQILIPNAKTSIIPNGIISSEFKRAIHLEKKEKKIILFISRIHKKKGIELLLNSWKLLSDLWDSWEIQIVGDGDEAYIESLNRLIIDLKLNSVNIEGPKYGVDKIEAYSNADIFVLPTFSENFGIVVAEAMASALPVITTIATPWDEIKELSIGEIIPPQDHELSLALRKWTSMSCRERQSAGDRALQLIENKYDLSLVAKKFKEFYDALN